MKNSLRQSSGTLGTQGLRRRSSSEETTRRKKTSRSSKGKNRDGQKSKHPNLGGEKGLQVTPHRQLSNALDVGRRAMLGESAECRVKMEDAKCSMVATQAQPEWTKTLKINGHTITALLDTGCTKSLVHPKYVEETDYLRWIIPYHTASNKGMYFPASRVAIELEGKKMTLDVGVSKHLSEEMLMGRDIPHFKQLIRKELKKEMRENTSPATVET